MTDTADVVVIGAGQAGLALSHELSRQAINHVILERGRVGEAWRRRWDNFCLVTPNWTVQLPGGAYRGEDPDGFMPRDEIVAHLEHYARSIDAPVREGVSVSALVPGASGEWSLQTAVGEVRARHVVLATGAYQRPHRPRVWEQLPPSLHVIDAESYANPESLPVGKVLVVGSGQTGCQIAEELAEAGREVFVACGRAPWAPRRLGGRDIVWWVAQTPFLDATLSDLPSPLARLTANVLTSGRLGGHDLHYRTLQAQGVELLGRFEGARDGFALFAPDLAESVAFGDARYADLRSLIERACAEMGIEAPEMPQPPPFSATPAERLDLHGFGAAVFTSGFRPDYTSWVRLPGAFDEWGFPIQADGSSTVAAGLHFMGVHFQRKRKSATFLGVAEDATVLAEHLGTGG
jgi:glycine/D-amino acid oxidase-like deaminating enzyme